MNFDPRDIGENPFVQGLLGAFVALRWIPGITYWEKLFNLTSGCLAAGFLSPWIAEYFGLVSSAAQGASAFSVGVFFVNSADSVMTAIKTVKLADYIPIKKTGGGNE